MSKIDRLIKVFVQDKASHYSWVLRKEIAIWSAIIFYSAILWTIFNTGFKGCKNISMPIAICSIITLAIIAKIFFSFVHSQFSSIYYTGCRMVALFNIIQTIIDNPDSAKKLDSSEQKDSFYPKYIKTEMDTLWPKYQPFRGKLHPIKIFLIFWFGWFYKKSTRDKLSNHHKQEACIYSLILLMNVIYVYLIIKSIA